MGPGELFPKLLLASGWYLETETANANMPTLACHTAAEEQGDSSEPSLEEEVENQSLYHVEKSKATCFLGNALLWKLKLSWSLAVVQWL